MSRIGPAPQPTSTPIRRLFGGYPGSLLAPDDNISRYDADQTNEDLGIFGEASYKLTDTWTVTVGGRYFDTKSDSTVARPPSALFPDSFDPVGSSFREVQSETGFTPKASISYRASDDLMVYALYSQGFRVGGANPNPPGLTGVPTSYDSDTVDNYEIGLKTSSPTSACWSMWLPSTSSGTTCRFVCSRRRRSSTPT